MKCPSLPAICPNLVKRFHYDFITILLPFHYTFNTIYHHLLPFHYTSIMINHHFITILLHSITIYQHLTTILLHFYYEGVIKYETQVDY